MDNQDEGGEFDSTINDPLYQILGKQAELYRQGGHGLEKDPSKAGQSTVLFCFNKKKLPKFLDKGMNLKL